MNQSRRTFLKSSLAVAGIFSVSDAFSSMGSQSGFLKNIGVCTSVTNSEILKKYGYSYIEEGVRNFLVPSESEDKFSEQLALAGKSKLPVTACNSFLPGNLKSVGKEAVHTEILKFAETAFRRAKITGVKIIVFGSGGSRAIPEGFPREKAKEQFINLCSQMGPIAAKYDVIVVIEPLNKKECNFINSVSEGGEIVKAVKHPNIQLLADLYHMKMDDEGPESILKYGKLLRHVHIAEKEGRAAPGTHREDFRPYFEALKKVRYKGNISVECKWENFEAQIPLVIKAIQEQI
ncbi:MAG: xylose isomerase [Bacteroidetes bacterium GWF2_42_66]|nr:MAG: xylose isomerase [Bacteroidetes bacterium GWA2_42_15]OFX97931.1 MAG: xylose isomerase [Bacteroidetes bacterium GWE2_42_39]OFY45832.1 MAG: xylose isomerase [Bacteroidetes bacterium GWF2_42_66]HBL74667.1 sugar phosphate isomerase/epimerase [Prolixibacteraceae bacterium]HCR89352.1 sugar phosphate isomerase/epimerase [Prolixibacteraceae bacterium]